jgi:hypothetical protein
MTRDAGRHTCATPSFEPTIGRDLLALGPVRRPALLRQVFGVCVTSPAQIVSLQKLQGQLEERGALETIAHYLRLLEEAGGCPPEAWTSGRSAAGRPAEADHAQSRPAGRHAPQRDSAAGPRSGPLRRMGRERLPELCVECRATRRLLARGTLEIDGVLDGNWGRWAIEVTAGRVTSRELRGLGEFTRRFPEYRPLVVCEPGGQAAAERLGIAAMSWQDFLWAGPVKKR